MADTSLLIQEIHHQTAVLTLNRPRVMNSLNFDLLRTFETVVRDLRQHRKIRCVIITGKGEKAFCAGADLKERETLSPEEVQQFILSLRNLFTHIQHLPVPVIAAINGAALGGGLELALAADIRLASDTSVMGMPETRLAIIPGGGGTQRLPRLIGIARAKEMIFTGRRMDAKEALELGLVNRVVQADTLMEQSLGMAEMIAQTGPVAVEMAKYAIDRGMQTDLDTGLAIESNAYRVTIPTRDRTEALAAFREKRPPRFTGE